MQVSTKRPTWQELYFNIAKLVAQRSEDPKTKVGAVLVKDGCVIGIGYNGAPRKFTGEIPWETPEKENYVIHAEMNAIANACAMGIDVRGSEIYITMSPCATCMKLLLQHQIKAVYYLEQYRIFDATKYMAEHSNIILKQIKEEKND